MTDDFATDAGFQPGQATATTDPATGISSSTPYADPALDANPATATRDPVGVMDTDASAASRARAGRPGWLTSTDQATADGIPSAAAIAGHPLHPMLVPLPIGLLAGAFGSDLAYAATHDRLWARASLALTAAGVLAGATAGSLGAVDFLSRARIRQQPMAWMHGGGNALVLGLGLLSVAARFRAPERAVLPTGLLLSATSAGLLLATGWLGGELVYRYRAGVIPR